MTPKLTNFERDATCDSTTTNDGSASADAVTDHGTENDPPVILAGGHGDRGDLAAITPLAEEGHDERLHPRRAEKKGEKIVQALQGAPEATRTRRQASGGRGRR